MFWTFFIQVKNFLDIFHRSFLRVGFDPVTDSGCKENDNSILKNVIDATFCNGFSAFAF